MNLSSLSTSCAHACYQLSILWKAKETVILHFSFHWLPFIVNAANRKRKFMWFCCFPEFKFGAICPANSYHVKTQTLNLQDCSDAGSEVQYTMLHFGCIISRIIFFKKDTREHDIVLQLLRSNARVDWLCLQTISNEIHKGYVFDCRKENKNSV